MKIRRNIFTEISYISANYEFNMLFDEQNIDVVEDVVKATYPKAKTNYQAQGYSSYHNFVDTETNNGIVGMIDVDSVLMDAINLYNQNVNNDEQIKLLDMPDFELSDFKFFLIHKNIKHNIDQELLHGTGDGKAEKKFISIINNEN